MTANIDISAADWNRLQRQVGRLRAGLIITLLLLVGLAVILLLHRPGDIIRTQGIVIVDAQGHDRMLIGAPVPASADRTRKDDRSDGIIFLGSTGADRLAVGQLPKLHIDGKTYPRGGDADSYGITLYDTKGSERGGMAFMATGRVGLALDRATPPYESIGLMVDDKENSAKMYFNYGDPKARESALELGTDADSGHIQLNGKDGLPHAMLSVDGKGKPAWQFDDAASAASAASAAKAAQSETH